LRKRFSKKSAFIIRFFLNLMLTRTLDYVKFSLFTVKSSVNIEDWYFTAKGKPFQSGTKRPDSRNVLCLLMLLFGSPLTVMGNPFRNAGADSWPEKWKRVRMQLILFDLAILDDECGSLARMMLKNLRCLNRKSWLK
jgi:hypothetical protein